MTVTVTVIVAPLLELEVVAKTASIDPIGLDLALENQLSELSARDQESASASHQLRGHRGLDSSPLTAPGPNPSPIIRSRFRLEFGLGAADA